MSYGTVNQAAGLGRREFLAASALCAAGVSFAGAAPPAGFKTALSKAMIVGAAPKEATLRKVKAAGFDGVEARAANPAEAARSKEAAERVGIRIHSVLRGWAEFNSDNPAKVKDSIATTEKALRAAQAYGADAVLLVPCRIGGMPMPRPWEFVVDFDPQSGHVKRVTTGDNKPFRAYIEAHNHAIDTSAAAIRKLIPVAEKTGVILTIENVWNNLWVTPHHFRHFVASFRSPWIKAYFDIANHVKYGRPEEWILILNDLIAKCHVKEFKLNPADPNGGGSWPNLREGSVRWPVVRQALERIGYSGWLTLEGGRLTPAEASRRIDLIIAGK